MIPFIAVVTCLTHPMKAFGAFAVLHDLGASNNLRKHVLVSTLISTSKNQDPCKCSPAVQLSMQREQGRPDSFSPRSPHHLLSATRNRFASPDLAASTFPERQASHSGSITADASPRHSSATSLARSFLIQEHETLEAVNSATPNDTLVPTD